MNKKKEKRKKVKLRETTNRKRQKMTIKINENKNKTKEHSDRLFLKSKLRAKSAAAKRVWHSLTRWAEDSYLNTTKHKSGIRICRRK